MDRQRGLSVGEVEKSRQAHGSNEIAKTHVFSVWKLLLTQFVSPLMLVLIVAGGMSYFLHGIVDALVVWAAVGLNGLLGFYQEFRAEKALEALEKQVEIEVDTERGGKRIAVRLEELVVGDVVYVKAGDMIPADGLVVTAEAMTVSEAMLTGESVPVEKKANADELEERDGEGKVFMGTIVLTGIGVLHVTAVGKETEMGKIAASLAGEQRAETPLQSKMAQFARVLTVVIVILAIGLFVVGWLRGVPVREIFMVAVAVAVSAIPEGLVVALTMILVLGMQRLLKRKALVRKLLAAETLGSVTVLCVDKTGTLTRGIMRVVESEGEEPRLAELAQLCNDLSDPIEVAMQEWGEALCRVSTVGCKISEWKRTVTKPFDPEKKYAASEHIYKKHRKVIVRGAPEVVLEMTRFDPATKREWRKKIELLASRGYRLVGIAEKVIKVGEKERMLDDFLGSKEMEWAGLLIMEDPVRENVKEVITKLQPAGVEFKLVTGDFAATAGYVMGRLGLEVKGMTVLGKDFRKMTRREKLRTAKKCVLFARFSPGDKLMLVKMLQQQGEVVAMMGDGVNDAPALKAAEVGIVVSSAAEVSKETAEMVLLDDQLETVVAGIEEGRGIYERIKRVVSYLLSDSFSEVVLVSCSLIIGLPLPVTAVQILWVNMASDSFPALALSVDPVEKDVMSEKPVDRSAPVVDNELKWLIGIVSVAGGLGVLGLFAWYMRAGFSLEYARTVAFTFLGVNTLLTVFVIRNLKKPFWQINIFNNLWLWAGVGVGLILQLVAVYLPPLQRLLSTQALMGRELLVIGVLSLWMVGLIELLKMGWRKVGARV